METGKGYRLRKFRYEIVPGFTSTAILYEPQTMQGRVPAILNVIGHEPNGNAVEYEQKRCINFAKRGMLALSLSWIGFGETGPAGECPRLHRATRPGGHQRGGLLLSFHAAGIGFPGVVAAGRPGPARGDRPFRRRLANGASEFSR